MLLPCQCNAPEATKPRLPGRSKTKAWAVTLEPKVANLALQGGGAHGAFTWGVLDCLLNEPRLELEGISATSAGAINAVVLAPGLTVGGRAGAASALADFWRRVATEAERGGLQPAWFDRLTHNYGLEHSPAYLLFDLMSRMFSPYQFNPGNYNPLAKLLERTVDFDRL